MRVIGGVYRSRPLTAPSGAETRPTSDRLRETLFNVIAPYLPDARFADLYAGSGAVGIEALSRGAASVTFVESAGPALRALRSNLAALQIRDRCEVEPRSVAVALRGAVARRPLWRIIFLDPPYAATREYSGTLRLLGQHADALLAPDGVVIAEHRRRMQPPLPQCFEELCRYRLLEQGDAALSFFARGHRP